MVAVQFIHIFLNINCLHLPEKLSMFIFLDIMCKALIYFDEVMIVLNVTHNQQTNRTWWRHQMKTSFALLALGEPPVTSSFPHKGQWRGAIDVFVDLHLYKCWANNPDTGDFKRHGTYYNVTVTVATVGNTINILSQASNVILTHLPLMPHICVSESGQLWFR